MTDESLRDIADAVILQAVTDWRRLCKKALTEKVKNPVIDERSETITFWTLRQFFKSDWCALLCRKANPTIILAGLERERKVAINSIKKEVTV